MMAGSRHGSSAASAGNRRPVVVRHDGDDERSTTNREGFGAWLNSPALDFYAIAITGGLLIVIGLFMVLSSSSVVNIAQGKSPFHGFMSQAMYASIGLIALFAALLVPIRLLKKQWFVFTGFVLAIGLQILVFVPGIGRVINGNRNWVKFGPVQGQPSEFLKLALALWLGVFLAKNRDRLREVPVLATGVASAAVALGLVAGGKDLGTMMMMAALSAGAMWAAGVPKRWFGFGGILAAVIVLGLVIQSPNRMARVGNWLHGTCEGDSCFQAKNGLMALAEGGWWGLGLGQSRQKWGRIPHPDNDFIFAIIGEELGLVGTLSVLVLFILLALALNRMMSRVKDPFIQIATAGIATWILVQAFVNMAVVSGLLPVLGVPLPFVSAGGSALVASMMALGLLLNFARQEPGAWDAITAKSGFTRRSAAVVAEPARPAPRRRVRHNRKD